MQIGDKSLLTIDLLKKKNKHLWLNL